MIESVPVSYVPYYMNLERHYLFSVSSGYLDIISDRVSITHAAKYCSDE